MPSIGSVALAVKLVVGFAIPVCLIGGGRLMVSGWRRASGGGRGHGCLLASGRWTERLGHLFSLISSAHPIGSVPGLSAHSISHHLIDGEGLSFPFRLTPSRLLFSVCLLGACSPVPGRGMCWLRHGLRRRACGLLACVFISRSALSLPLVRLLLYVPCRSCHCSYLGSCGAFYDLFLLLTCRRWRF